MAFRHIVKSVGGLSAMAHRTKTFNSLLIPAIIDLSVANQWDMAKLEWDCAKEPYEVDFDYGHACICGHSPIRYVYTLVNRRNKHEAELGSCCIRQFLNLEEKEFSSITRVRADKCKALSLGLVEVALKNKWISAYHFVFYADTIRKRKLSSAQLAMRQEINDLILFQLRPIEV
jgi:hypothetical protein